MLLVHPYTPEVRPADQQKTWDAINHLHNIAVEHVKCPKGTAVWPMEFRRLWGSTDIIICEHDIAVTQEAYNDLVSCTHTHCAYAYKLYNSLGNGIYSQLIGGVPIPKACPYADQVGFGLTKIKQEVMSFPLHQQFTWSNMDSVVSRAIFLHHGAWHVHWPEIEHHHKPPIPTIPKEWSRA